MIIGNFTYDADRDTYVGAIRTLSFERGDVQLRPNRKNGEKDPDYRVIEESPMGTIELGAAWSRRSEKGNAFLSVLLDGPAMAQPLSVALFNDGRGSATLVWTRPRAPLGEQKNQREAEPSGSAPSATIPAPRRRRRDAADDLHT